MLVFLGGQRTEYKVSEMGQDSRPPPLIFLDLPAETTQPLVDCNSRKINTRCRPALYDRMLYVILAAGCEEGVYGGTAHQRGELRTPRFHIP